MKLSDHNPAIDKIIKQKEEHIHEADTLLDLSDRILKIKSAHISHLEKTLKDKESLIASYDNLISQKEQHAIDLKDTIRKKETHISSLEAAIKDNEYRITRLDNNLTQKVQGIADLKEAIKQKDHHIADLKEAIKQKDHHISDFKESVKQKDVHISDLDSSLHHKDEHIFNLENIAREKEAALSHIHNSHGWKGLLAYYRLRDKIFPPDTRRRSIATSTFDYLLDLKKISILRRTTSDDTESLSVRKIRKLKFQSFPSPKVSIIIPVRNKWKYTYKCLQSVLEHTDAVPYTVIIVNNGSTDETSRVLKRIRNIKIIQNPENRGFVEACNNGAGAADSEYILFLNNDTLVTAGWLQSMLVLAESSKDIGAVGAKLIHPDGRLQEAGGIVWNDPVHTAWNYGRDHDPDNYEFNYVREVDYCSAACLLVKRSLFESSGNFDMRYAPAYFEDTSLAFSLRKQGYKVMYQPLAKIVHFEGTTAGTDISAGYKKFQSANQEKFYKYWKSTLDSYHFNAGDHVFLARDRSRRKKIMLFVDHYVPEWDKDAGSFITYQYLAVFIKMGFKIIFWPDNLYKMEPYTTELQQMGIEVVYGHQNFSEYIRERGKYIHVAFISRPNIAIKYIDDVKQWTNAKVLYCAHDLHFLRQQRRATVENNPGILNEVSRWKTDEFYLMEHSNITLLFSDAEKTVLEKENPGIKSTVIPWIQPVNMSTIPYKERKDIIFIGGFFHAPNEDAVLWFTGDIFPQIKKNIPGVRFIVIGSHPTEKILALESDDIIVTGHVKDVSPYFKRARIFVAPLRYGAGFKGKIVLAMSYGLPVITTTIGSEGMGLSDGENVFISNEPKEFADKVISVYSDESLWNELSRNSFMYVQTNHSVDKAIKKLEHVLSYELFQDINGSESVISRGLDTPVCSGSIVSQEGICTVCGNNATFQQTGDNLRESFSCTFCSSNSRNRHIAKILCQVIGREDIVSLSEFSSIYHHKKIFEAQASGSIHGILKKLHGYVCSEYFTDVQSGSSRNGVQCENLEALSFPHNTFDIVITQDVFEHIRDPFKAFREVHRVLKPWGYHIFTIPYHESSKTVKRIKIEGDRDIHILPAVFHGDGIRDGLVYTDFGNDIAVELEHIGFSTELFWSNDEDRARNQIHSSVVFVSRKRTE